MMGEGKQSCIAEHPSLSFLNRDLDDIFPNPYPSFVKF